MAILGLCLIVITDVASQPNDSLVLITGVVYDEYFNPLSYTHVISTASHYGDITDTLGIFIIPYIEGDTLLFRNISFNDTLIAVDDHAFPFIIHLRKKYYILQEAKVFNWGATYDDFTEYFTNMPVMESLGETLGLPRQDPDYIPFDKDEAQIKSLGFFLHSPLSFIYYNLSKKEKSARKVYALEKNRSKIELFESIYNRQNISEISGFTGEELERFMVYLNDHFLCDYNCSEIEILSEIHFLLKVYTSM